MTTRSSIRYAAAATYRRLPKATVALPFVFATALAGSLWAATAQADPLIVGNSFGRPGVGFRIQTWDFATGALVGSFVPTGNNGGPGGGLAVLGNKVYYTNTKLTFPGPPGTDFIRVAPFNGGTGGADITTLPNPQTQQPGNIVVDLHVANGVLYALTVKGFGGPLQVFGLNPLTGEVASGPVTISGPADTGSDGFTVLPNGNFLINSTRGSCTYNQFNPKTGAAVIPATTITLTGFSSCTGVDTNGVHLFFSTDLNSLTETDFTGFVISTKAVTSQIECSLNFHVCNEDISLVTFGASGVPGEPSCERKTIRDLKHQYGDKDEVLSALGYSSKAALKSAIDRFCDTP